MYCSKWYRFFILLQGYALSVNIKLTGPEYVKFGEHAWVNCSSDVSPYGYIAEFIVNGVTFNSLQRHKTGCFSANYETECLQDMCKCSNDGKSYAVRVGSTKQTRSLNIVCSMQFKLVRSFVQTENISIRVLDIEGPFITAEGGFPLIAGRNTRMTCIVQSTLDVKLLLHCHDMLIRKSERFNESTVYVSVDLNIKTNNDYKMCTCSSQFENFTTSTSVALQVFNPPVMEIVGKTVCNSSLSIELSCSLSGDLDTYGFDLWQHAIDGVVVRELIGVISNNTSALVISSCSFNDRGDYTCIAWNRKKRKKDYLRTSTQVKVNEPPFIVASYLYNESIPVLSVDYLSDAEPNSPRWFRYKTSLVNSTLFTIINTRTTLVSQIHGKEVTLSGFSTNLSLNNKARGEYTVMLSNRYGETEYKFNLISEQSSFLFSIILLVLTGMVVFIVTVGVIGTVIKINSLTGDLEMKCYPKNPGRGAIYYAAPEDENQVHVYNETDTGYEESTESNETGHYMEISDIYEDLENGRDDRHSYEFSHHYIEVKPD